MEQLEKRNVPSAFKLANVWHCACTARKLEENLLKEESIRLGLSSAYLDISHDKTAVAGES